MDIKELRRVEVLVDGNWTAGTWPDLKAGTVFRLYEPDGVLHADPSGDSVFLATSDAYPEPAPTYYCIECEPYAQG